MANGQDSSLIGKVIDKKYRIESLIGDGGMGKVYLVKHAQLGKIFALKLMSFDENSDSNQVLRFKREARVLAKIDHPNVVMIIDFGITEELAPYIVMEYVEGITLRKLIDKKKQLTEKETLSIAEQICAGIHAAHLKGIIHRDLKPENIMVRQLPDGSMSIRVLDFGIAKLLKSNKGNTSNLTAEIFNTGTVGRVELTGKNVPGTLRYMAYEQVMGEDVDARTDVYSISVIIYEMLTGIVPSIISAKIDPIDTLRPDLSPLLVEAIHKGLSELKEDRQENVLELKQELEAVRLSNPSYKNTRSQPDDEQFSPEYAIRRINSSRRNPQEKEEGKNSIAISLKKLYLTSIIILILLATITSLLLFPQLKESLFSMWGSGSSAKSAKVPLPILVPVKGGKFMMGSNKGDEYARPEHLVEVKSFVVGQYLVTNSQYNEFVKQTNHKPPQNWENSTPPNNLIDKPVTYISWDDANAYCKWLSNQTGKSFRLLTEEEWEFLAQNKNTIQVSEILDSYQEWTSSEFVLYPGSKSKIREWDAKVRIFRGKSKESINEPVTFRFFQFENYTFPSLCFRVALNVE